MAKKNVVSADIKKVGRLLDNIPEDRQPIAKGLYEELEFMYETMAALKQQVREEGATAMFQQGRQEFLREHPALTAYNKTIQRYNQTYKQMIDLLPASNGNQEADPLMEFIQG